MDWVAASSPKGLGMALTWLEDKKMSRMGSLRAWGKITVLIAVCGWVLSAQAKYAGGSGTQAEPFRISAVSDWQELMTTPADWASHFVLTADIDLNDVTIAPVGNSSTAFTGVFDGNGHIIQRANIHLPVSDYVGLFGHLVGGVESLGVADITITGRNMVGGLAGRNSGSVTASWTAGSIAGVSSSAGGLVGYNSGSITACYTGASVTVSSPSGRFVGGLVGYVSSGSVRACYSTGLVGCPGSAVGGLAGYNDSGSLVASFWNIETSGQSGGAGGKGLTSSQMRSLTVYRNAGWAGNGWTIDDGVDYPRLEWERADGTPIPLAQPVPLLGEGTAERPYQIWTPSDFALLSWYASILDTHIALMADVDLAGTLLYPVGDLGAFAGVFHGNGHSISNADVNMPDSDCVGLFGSVALTGSVRDLHVENILATGMTYVGGVAGQNRGSFTACCASGSVAGRRGVGILAGHNTGSVSGCSASGVVSSYSRVGGLVGYNFGVVSSCYATASSTGDERVGGLVGENYNGRLATCNASGSVSGSSDVGGLVGYNSRGTVELCYAVGSVMGDTNVGGLVGGNLGSVAKCSARSPVSGTGNNVGGLVGSNLRDSGITGSIIESYANGQVTGDSRVGGLVGSDAGDLKACYTTSLANGNSYVGGLVGKKSGGSVLACFWDIETSDCNTSAGGTPKTTAEMKTQSTFTAAGWDFVGETANGTEDIWAICEGTNYPRFVYQIPQGDIVCPDGVNGVDYSLLGRYWHETDCAVLDDCEGADIDLSGGVDFGDVAAVAESWLRDVR